MTFYWTLKGFILIVAVDVSGWICLSSACFDISCIFVFYSSFAHLLFLLCQIDIFVTQFNYSIECFGLILTVVWTKNYIMHFLIYHNMLHVNTELILAIYIATISFICFVILLFVLYSYAINEVTQCYYHCFKQLCMYFQKLSVHYYTY